MSGENETRDLKDLEGDSEGTITQIAKWARQLGEQAQPAIAEIAWVSVNGPRTAAEALRMATSAKARSRLRVAWKEQCPSPQLLDRAVATSDATDDERDLANATNSLIVSLHAQDCTACRSYLAQLAVAQEGFEPDHELEVEILCGQYSLQLPASAGSRGATEFIFPLTELDDEDFLSLVGRVRGELDLPPNVRLQSTAEPDGQYQVTVRLAVPSGLDPGITAVTVLVTRDGQTCPIEMALPERDDFDIDELVGHALIQDWSETAARAIVQVRVTRVSSEG